MPDPAPPLQPPPGAADQIPGYLLTPQPRHPLPPPRRGLPTRTVLLLCLVFSLLAGVGGSGLLAYASKRTPVAATMAEAPAPASARTAGDPRTEAAQQTQAAIAGALTAQGGALLAGNRRGFSAAADPTAGAVASWLRDRYTSLRAMGIQQWSPSVLSYTMGSDARWKATVQVTYCFTTFCPRPMTLRLETSWNVADPAVPLLSAVSVAAGREVPPWAQSALTASVGDRVIVASTSANTGRLASIIGAAEAAAYNADKYAIGAPPGKYVVYLATAKEWSTWPYAHEGEWVAGYANQATESVVLNIPALRPAEMSVILRHELGHVATLAGKSGTAIGRDSWWLTEGLADYIAMQERPWKNYFRGPETSKYVHRGWDGDLRVSPPSSRASVTEASARYGTAYLGVSCLMHEFGRAQTLAYFHAVAVDGEPLSTATESLLSVSWPSLNSSCRSWIHDVVGD